MIFKQLFDYNTCNNFVSLSFYWSKTIERKRNREDNIL